MPDTKPGMAVLTALKEAREKFPPIKKASTGDTGKRKYQYADLDSIIGAVTVPLSEAGLILTHSLSFDAANGISLLATRLSHLPSGESSEPAIFPIRAYDRPQDFGSALTYGRRYSAGVLLGVVYDDDDDGKAATDAEPSRTAPSAPRGQQKKDPEPPVGIGAKGSDILWSLARKIHGANAETFMRKLIAKHGVKNTADLKAGDSKEPYIEYELWLENEAAMLKEKR